MSIEVILVEEQSGNDASRNVFTRPRKIHTNSNVFLTTSGSVKTKDGIVGKSFEILTKI